MIQKLFNGPKGSLLHTGHSHTNWDLSFEPQQENSKLEGIH